MDTRLNGGKILYAATSLEKKLEEVILLYFFGILKEPNPKRDFFANEVLKASDLTFSYKKELVGYCQMLWTEGTLRPES
jgi:hypothetical protein